ncbi:MAG: hypothetical protein LBI85_00530 [Spirochaetaceae bacterium]|jgi:hypothetical protein|nr:hypothetical protein [Spirochaetaceae bacterium]
MEQREPGLFLCLTDIAVLCGLLKPMEERLNAGERTVLSRMERELYSHMSIEEAAKLLGHGGSSEKGGR